MIRFLKAASIRVLLFMHWLLDEPCDHESVPWCHVLSNGSHVWIQVCVNCQLDETQDRCQKRYDDELAAAMPEFPPNCP